MCGWCLAQLSRLPSNVSNLFNKLNSFSKADSHWERGETSVQTPLWRFSQWGSICDLEKQGGRGGRGCRMLYTSDGHCCMSRPENNGCTVWLSWCFLKWFDTATSQQPKLCNWTSSSCPKWTLRDPSMAEFEISHLCKSESPHSDWRQSPKGQNPAHTKSLLGCTTTSRHIEKQKLDMDLFTDTMWWLSWGRKSLTGRWQEATLFPAGSPVP